MAEGRAALTTKDVFRTWWPLAGSWVLMALEGPSMNIVVARLADPTIHLAAYGSVVFPLALLIEAPIVMLLAASTALCTDRFAYLRIRRLVHGAGALLTGLHALVALSPLYNWIVLGLLDAPPEIVQPARLGLIAMLPWTWSIAYRRFNQGVLIRYGHSPAVGVGTLIRLGANGIVLAAGYLWGAASGTLVAATAIIAGVLSEALYTGLRVRPVLHRELPSSSGSKLTYKGFFRFYIPLSLTSLILLGARPIYTAAVSRMPEALDSLAVLPVVTGLVFLFRSVGTAYNEVVIAHLDHPGSARVLQRFTRGMVLATTLGAIAVAATPLASVWFGTVTGLHDRLLGLARSGFWFALLLPGITVSQSWFQGIILHSRKTRSITEAILVYLVTIAVLLTGGVLWGKIDGIYVALIGMSVAEILRNGWLWWKSRPAWRRLLQRDS